VPSEVAETAILGRNSEVVYKWGKCDCPRSSLVAGLHIMTETPLVDGFEVPLRGVGVDSETRCVHYNTRQDVIALRFGCCEQYFPCHACHEAVADHDPVPWPRARFEESAVLCGVCRNTLSAREYLANPLECPICGVKFNPDCQAHHAEYFEGE
jgi:Uncharacterized conserved protein